VFQGTQSTSSGHPSVFQGISGYPKASQGTTRCPRRVSQNILGYLSIPRGQRYPNVPQKGIPRNSRISYGILGYLNLSHSISGCPELPQGVPGYPRANLLQGTSKGYPRVSHGTPEIPQNGIPGYPSVSHGISVYS